MAKKISYMFTPPVSLNFRNNADTIAIVLSGKAIVCLRCELFHANGYTSRVSQNYF